MTSEPESEEVTKKNTMIAMARTLVTTPSGRPSRSWKREVLVLTSPPSSMSPSLRCRRMAESPKIVNHSSPIIVGASRTPMTNCRMVRPREIRAMNIPTKGAQLIHQPQ